MNDKNNWVLKWMTGALWGVVVLGLTLTAQGVIANDDKNTKDHVAIRKEVVEGNAKINDKIDKKFEEINDKQTVLLVQQAQMAIILEKIEKKLE